MRAAEFETRLAATKAPPIQPARAPEDEIFVTYSQLPDFGVPKYCRPHLRRLMLRGLFPGAVQVSPNRIAWRLSDLAAWKASRPAAPMPIEVS